MKKLYTLSFLILFAFAANAQNYDVTLAVDMTNVMTVSDTVCVAGTFQDDDTYLTGIGEWSAGAHILTDGDANGVYRITINVPGGDYQYKYINGGNWGNNEGAGIDATCGVDDGFGNFNRAMTITSDTTIAYIYDACTETMLPLNTGAIANVTTFKVAPNPFTNSAVVTIENASSTTHDVVVTNIAGGVVRTMNAVQGSQITIDRGNLVSGIYFVTLINEKGERGTKKIAIH